MCHHVTSILHLFIFPYTVRQRLSRTSSLLHLFGSSAACCSSTTNISSCPFPLRMYYILVSSLFRSPISSIAEAGNPTSTAASFGRKYSQSALYPAGFTVFRPACRDMSPHWTLLPNTTLLSRPQAFHSQRTTLLHHHDTLLSFIATFFFFSGSTALHPHLPLILTMTIPLFPCPIGSLPSRQPVLSRRHHWVQLPPADERHFRCPKIRRISHVLALANIAAHDFIIQHCDVCGQVCDVDNALRNVFHAECSLGNQPPTRL